MSPRMPMPQRPKSPARQIAELERHRRREERRLDDATSGRTGDSVVGSVSVQSFEIAAPGSDGFTITLPGAPSLAWSCSLTMEASSFVGQTFILTPIMAGVAYTPRSIVGGTGTPFGTQSVVRTFYGGDEITCEAAVTTTPDETLGVTIDFSAIRLS